MLRAWWISRLFHDSMEPLGELWYDWTGIAHLNQFNVLLCQSDTFKNVVPWILEHFYKSCVKDSSESNFNKLDPESKTMRGNNKRSWETTTIDLHNECYTNYSPKYSGNTPGFSRQMLYRYHKTSIFCWRSCSWLHLPRISSVIRQAY